MLVLESFSKTSFFVQLWFFFFFFCSARLYLFTVLMDHIHNRNWCVSVTLPCMCTSICWGLLQTLLGLGFFLFFRLNRFLEYELHSPGWSPFHGVPCRHIWWRSYFPSSFCCFVGRTPLGDDDGDTRGHVGKTWHTNIVVCVTSLHVGYRRDLRIR